jgi:hypothetical protein
MRILLALFALFLAAPVSAGWTVPLPIGGDYQWRVVPADVPLDLDGVPLSAPTVSVSIENAAESFGCTNLSPGETYDEQNPALILTTIPAPTSPPMRVKVRAHAFSSPACSGWKSEGSTDFGAVFFNGPSAPVLSIQWGKFPTYAPTDDTLLSDVTQRDRTTL